jgi:hypothetical protein
MLKRQSGKIIGFEQYKSFSKIEYVFPSRFYT